MAVFPADVVAEILSRLPVKALLRFRSVCKIWCALIDCDHFIKSHLHRSIETKNNRQIILTRGGLHSISLDSLDVAEECDYPLASDSSLVAVHSCNGLLLLWTRGDDSAIWNPSTQKFRKIPRPVHNGQLCSSMNVSFGYDAVSDDYKVLSFYQLNYPQISESNVQLYSLKSNSWRTVKDFPYFISCTDDGVFAHGALHWFQDKGVVYKAHSARSIVSFDLATEETRLVSLPEEVCGNDVLLDLVVLEGCLCVIACLPRRYNIPKFECAWVMKDRYNIPRFECAWVMKDYFAGDSWDKLLSASQLSVMGSFSTVFPFAYSKNGRELLLLRDYEEFIWFDLEHNSVRKIKVQGLPNDVVAKVIVQSLEPLGSGGKTNPEEERIPDTKTGMKRL